jgi:hypothetical protein
MNIKKQWNIACKELILVNNVHIGNIKTFSTFVKDNLIYDPF